MDTAIGILLGTAFGFLAFCVFVGAIALLIRELTKKW